MQTRRGEILDHGDSVEPQLSSAHVTVRGDFMQRHLRRRFRTPLKDQHPRGQIVRAPGPMARQAVVKVWQPTPKTTGRHLTYLTREGAGEQGRRAELFTAEGRAFDRKAFVAAAKEDPGQYRMMFSVEDHHLVNLPQLTRALMQQVEHDVLQANVDWVAAVHGGEHPHVHLLMRGVDAAGNEVHFTHDYRLQSLRYQVQTLLTRWLGEVEHPTDAKDLDAWAEAHLKETQLMIDPSARAEDDQPSVPAPALIPYEPLVPAPMPSERVLQRLGPEARHVVETLMTARQQAGDPLTREALAQILHDLQRERPEVVLRHHLPELWKGIRQPLTPPMVVAPTPDEVPSTPTPEPPVTVTAPLGPRTMSSEEAQRRLEETRQRMQQTIGRMNARYGVSTPGLTTDEPQARLEQLKARLQRETQHEQERTQQAVTRDRDPDGSMGMDV